MSHHEMNGDPMDDWRFGFEVKSDQLGAADTGNGKTYTITGVDFRKIGDGRDARMRPVVRVKESDLDWVTCKTTLFCIEAMFGRSPRGWIGKQITLHWDPTVKFGRDTVGGVRVKGAPGIRDMTVTVKLPKKKDQKIRLVNTGNQVDGDTLLRNACTDAGVSVEDVGRWLNTVHGADLSQLSDDDKARLAEHDLPTVREWVVRSEA